MSTIGWIILAAAIAVVVIVAILVIARISSSRRSSHLQRAVRAGVRPHGRRRRARAGRPSGSSADRETGALEAGPEAALERAHARGSRTSGRASSSGFSTIRREPPRRPSASSGRVMDERGYPPDNETTDRAATRVGRPSRRRRALPPRSRDSRRPRRRGQDERTENLRVAMVDFRAVLESLLETDSRAGADALTARREAGACARPSSPLSRWFRE